MAVRDHRRAARDRRRRRVVLARRSGQRSTDDEDDVDVDDEPTKREADVDEVAASRSPTTYYLVLAALLFTIGAVGLLVRRNVLVMFMCVELMLNAVNLTFVTFARELNDIARPGDRVLHAGRSRRPRSRSASAIIVAIFRRRRGATADDVDLLKG